ncbi:ABC transporter permease [Aliifodinibius sp. S!AR15-10]|uniref:cell division protein FtsX n=1 Tax=Aliifodinibius sp. S!AR15-10 TaxID=2950437 RepID=UPI00285DC5FE|nr:permease-like cell division protein FtsX [Aliifodinibius sp. S!AR15-10]MDR8390289.1 ABC transporter permease [Aliifodinibius sp. S!AR15-10]
MSLGYVIKEGVAGFKRARLASFTSIFSLFIAVLLLGVLARVSFNVYQVANALKQSIDVEVFLVDLDERTTREIRGKLEEEKLVQSLSYISKDSAAAIFREEFGAGGESLADLKFLPASFRLKINSEASVSQIDSLVTRLEDYRGVEEVRFNQQLLEMLQSRFETVAMAGGGIGLLILLAAVILVFNTIRLTIYAKRGLIKAMKLVGATNGFIRRPFVVEGIIQGFVAGLAAILVMYLFFLFLLPEYIPQFGVLEWPFGRWYYLCGAMLFLSIFMGYLGSLWAARRFIKKTSVSDE